MNFIVTSDVCAGFFGISNKDFMEKTQCYHWSGSFQDIHCWPTKADEKIYGLTGAGAYLALPFLEKVNRADITKYMSEIQKLSPDVDILEEMSNLLICEIDRINLLWLVDRLVLFDPRKVVLHDKIKKVVLPEACFYCGARIGELHRILFCDGELCPFCQDKSKNCDCQYDALGLTDHEKYTAGTAYLPPNIYCNGLSDELDQRWVELYTAKGRKPYQGPQ
jgi:hypothetical protein